MRPGFDRTLARYWHHGALTYCLSPPVVRNTEEDGSYVSLIHASPRFTGHGRGRKLRRLWYDARLAGQTGHSRCTGNRGDRRRGTRRKGAAAAIERRALRRAVREAVPGGV